MGPPDRTGRIALLTKLLSHMPTTDDILPEILADLTSNLSGAEIVHITNEAGLLAVKEAIANNTPAETIRISTKHFRQVINNTKQFSFKRSGLSLTNLVSNASLKTGCITS
jgi:SpoVK/Ycf46/Vps4 family AAA+-type ATPase